MRDILLNMFNAWILHEHSWVDGEGNGHSRTEDECFIEACGGDVIRAGMIQLFTYWSNDIERLAPHFGVSLEHNEEGKFYIREDIPPAPSPEHWWNNGAWVEPTADDTSEVIAG